jgi:hypothetical protein
MSIIDYVVRTSSESKVESGDSPFNSDAATIPPAEDDANNQHDRLSNDDDEDDTSDDGIYSDSLNRSSMFFSCMGNEVVQASCTVATEPASLALSLLPAFASNFLEGHSSSAVSAGSLMAKSVPLAASYTRPIGTDTLEEEQVEEIPPCQHQDAVTTTGPASSLLTAASLWAVTSSSAAESSGRFFL